MINLYNDDCLVILKTMDDNSIDSIVTDPPYGLSFMGKKWDYDVPNQEIFEECLRVLKPGGYLLSFSGSRTYHRMAVRVEDAGFEIRDQLMWLYGSGFPKSLNVGKAITATETYGASDPKSIRKARLGDEYEPTGQEDWQKGFFDKKTQGSDNKPIDTELTENGDKWKGWGTALKPAHEPIVMARKPLSEKTVATNVLKHGAGGINIDDSRVSLSDGDDPRLGGKGTWKTDKMAKDVYVGGYTGVDTASSKLGRFPSNVILSHHPECQCIGVKTVKGNSKPHELHSNTEQYEGWGNITFRKGEMVGHGDEDGNETVDDYICHEDCPIKIMDEQSGIKKSTRHMSYKRSGGEFIDGIPNQTDKSWFTQETGGASRFFYCAKTSKNERNLGLDDFPSKDGRNTHGKGMSNVIRKCPTHDVSIPSGKSTYGCGCGFKFDNNLTIKPTKNNHPTVKPIKLMKYLQTLVTPKDGTTLDPFMGSGTSGVSANIAGFNFIGIEMDEDYFKIAEARINASDDMELNDDDKVIISKPIESSIHDWFE